MAINLSTLVNQTNPIQLCKAWVNFNGSTASIRASYNVSSVTKNGTGDYTINFTTALTDANYAVVGTSGGNTGGATRMGDVTLYTTTQVRINTLNFSGSNTDQPISCLAVFGN